MLDAGKHALVPELMAATGARYSRSDVGLDALLEESSAEQQDQAADRILKFALDYGHASVLDMCPVPMFMDGLSIQLIYWVFAQCPTGSGQETSTRYVKFGAEGLIDPHTLGIPEALHPEWSALLDESFAAYHQAHVLWTRIFETDPRVAGIPGSLLAAAEAGDEKATKTVERLKRNFAFDRCRAFIPTACANNMMLIMSARNWAELITKLLSYPLPEFQDLGAALRSELELVTPRMVKHACVRQTWAMGQREEFLRLQARANSHVEQQIFDCWREPDLAATCTVIPQLELYRPDDQDGFYEPQLAEDLEFHDNRYAWIGPELKRIGVRMSWNAIDFACVRDLNRQRPGRKYVPLIPQGFYYALDQLPLWVAASTQAELQELAEIGRRASARAYELLAAGDPSYIYWTLLGTQFPYEHMTDLAHMTYIGELRTGTGAHYRYAAHLRDMLGLLYEELPELKSLILEGSAEPE